MLLVYELLCSTLPDFDLGHNLNSGLVSNLRAQPVYRLSLHDVTTLGMAAALLALRKGNLGR